MLTLGLHIPEDSYSLCNFVVTEHERELTAKSVGLAKVGL